MQGVILANSTFALGKMSEAFTDLAEWPLLRTPKFRFGFVQAGHWRERDGHRIVEAFWMTRIDFGNLAEPSDCPTLWKTVVHFRMPPTLFVLQGRPKIAQRFIAGLLAS